LKALANCDPELENPKGIVLSGIMYGGRDAKAYVPCQQGFDWNHGIVAYGASWRPRRRSRSSARKACRDQPDEHPGLRGDPLGQYIRNNLEFAKKLRNPPAVFG